MSFDFPQEPRRRKKGGISGIVMLLIIGFGLFMLMNSRGAGPAENGEAVEAGRPAGNRSQGKLDPRIDRELRQADEYRRQRESVLGESKPETARSSTDPKTMPSGKGANADGWSIEGVGGKKKASPAAAKKTKGEDGWSIEEVPTKKKTGTGFEVKGSGGGDVELKEKSDWSMEDVDPKTKKTKAKDGWSLEEVEGGGK